jgi:hypothetical protein
MDADRMMMLSQLLEKRKDTIARRWLEGAMAAYPGESAAAFMRQKDPFANPVGHSLRVGTREALDGLLQGANAERISECLHEIIKIRAVQQFSPSEAVSFVFCLKEAIRAEGREELGDAKFCSELVQFERQIDRVALAAFDLFVQCREQVYELRVNEMKRNVSWIVGKLNQRDCAQRLSGTDLGEGSLGVDAQREGFR